ncbi:VOC family protein [Corynebacterium lowii]|uniref:Glyoxalase/Bleomycin resistance protein/Dioxygenase superfamily protein n=1 Tax=Corynebacterium lowii TaxID=1544413 RepID=A0A0Q0ZAD3_9CORY|nr:VOC family protein [Corynebacterium lowii]KQB86816.1 Glyoxalase/Bleomycin resistance protein/Dioxygenase superfamily protein [Corynebacterium lowii]MDP9851503.1 catechol 2,3-dioxygenase-like lactoylglutathione lyase family enzyme [Corynebacterium lowii]
MRISVISIFVDDQEKALRFYRDTLGFKVSKDIVVDEEGHRWLTLRSPEQSQGPELLLEPAAHPAARDFREALYRDGMPFTQFEVESVEGEYRRLKEQGVSFSQEPMDVGEAVIAVLDDTCGNLIQLVEAK